MTRTIDIPLANGLHPTGMDSRGSKWLRTAKGLRVTEHGLEQWPDLTVLPLPSGQTFEAKTTWGKVRRDGTLLRAMKVSGNNTELLWEGANINSTTAYSVSTWGNVSPSAATISGTPTRWHIADAGGAWFLFDGAGATFFKTGHNANLWYAQYGQKCGCVHDGRLVLGGFDAAHAYDYAAWNTFFATHSSSLPTAYAALSVAAPSTNWVWWSTPGMDDALFWYNKTHLDDAIVDLLNMGATGFAIMPFPGNLVRVLPAQNGVVVYGERGVCLLESIDAPAPGYGVVPLQGWPRGMGVLAVDGDESGHLAVAADGTVWVVQNGAAQEAGYRYVFAGSAPIVAHDPMYGWFVGPDTGSKHYHFSQTGLVETYQKPNSVFVGASGAWTAAMATPTPAFDIVTDTVPATGTVNVAAVKLHGSWATNTYVSLYFRRNGSWVESAALQPDGRGMCLFNLPAHQFRVRVYGATVTGVKLERIEVVLDGVSMESNSRMRLVS